MAELYGSVRGGLQDDGRAVRLGEGAWLGVVGGYRHLCVGRLARVSVRQLGLAEL